MITKITPSFTYDDVLIRPKYSNVSSRKNVCLKTFLTKKIKLNTPIISSNMDSITEDDMAIEIAKLGGLGIIHRFCSIEQQVEMVKRVKRYTNYVIYNPYTIEEDTKMCDVVNLIHFKKVKSFMVVKNNVFSGIFTNRDFIYFRSLDFDIEDSVGKYMTKRENMITLDVNTLKKMEIHEIIEYMSTRKIQKIPILNGDKIYGLVTLKDMLQRNNEKFKTKANLDENSQLVVGAAVGVNKDFVERAKALHLSGCNIICIDVAHGHHSLCGNAVIELKKEIPNVQIIAGNVCTREGVKYLALCGADCVKVGIGPGSICITRKQTGCGAPQLSAVMECAEEARKLDITIIADGGHNGTIGNIFKALCAGAQASMLGGMISGTTETPGQVYTKLNKKVKQIRGMAGIMSNYNKSSKLGEDTSHIETMIPEGVEGYVTYKGPVKDIIHQIEGGIKSGLSYVGCEELRNLHNTEIELLMITNQGFRESGSHGISEI